MHPYLQLIVQLALSVIFAIWIFGAIARKAGYPRYIGFWMLVPLVNLGVLIWFANTEWPIESKLVRLSHGEPKAANAIWREEM